VKQGFIMLACLAGLAIATGCGGSGSSGAERLSKAEYEQRVQTIADGLRDEYQGLQNANPSDLDELAALMSRLGRTLDATAAKFDALSPPEDVEAAQDKFVTAARSLADLAREVADDVKNATPADLLNVEFQQKLDVEQSDAFKDLQEAAEEAKAKGYDFGDFGG
jgi:hypothetical protein